jgi:hypothetical protein
MRAILNETVIIYRQLSALDNRTQMSDDLSFFFAALLQLMKVRTERTNWKPIGNCVAVLTVLSALQLKSGHAEPQTRRCRLKGNPRRPVRK